MRQKTSCRDHTQEFNRTALLAGMNGNAALPWLYRQSLKNDIQQELLWETYATLEDLQKLLSLPTTYSSHSANKTQEIERETENPPDRVSTN